MIFQNYRATLFKTKMAVSIRIIVYLGIQSLVMVSLPGKIASIVRAVDNDSKAIMDAHLKERASHYS